MSDDEKLALAKPEHLTISLRTNRDREDGMQFKIKMNTKMQKVMDAYCKAEGVQGDARRFLFEGHRLQKDDTPESLQMEDGDVIDVFLEQQGGSLTNGI